MSSDPEEASADLHVWTGRERIRLTLQVLGSCVLLLAFWLIAPRVTESDWVRQLIFTAVTAIGLQAVALWKGWRARLPVPGLPMPKVLLWMAPLLVLAAMWIHYPPTISPNAAWIPILIFCLLIGFQEELFFRGFLFSLLKDVRPTTCLLVTSVIFGLFHYNRVASMILSSEL